MLPDNPRLWSETIEGMGFYCILKEIVAHRLLLWGKWLMLQLNVIHTAGLLFWYLWYIFMFLPLDVTQATSLMKRMDDLATKTRRYVCELNGLQLAHFTRKTLAGVRVNIQRGRVESEFVL